MFDLVINYDKLVAKLLKAHQEACQAAMPISPEPDVETLAKSNALYWLYMDVLEEYGRLEEVDVDLDVVDWGIAWTDMTLWLDKRIWEARKYERTYADQSWMQGMSKSQIEQTKMDRRATAEAAEKLKFELNELWQKCNVMRNGLK